MQKNFIGIEEYRAADLIRWSPALRKQLNAQHTFVHPEDPTINGLSHLLWAGKPLSETSTARNAVFYGEQAIDRSPCGTGTSARMAQWHAKGLLKPGEDFVHESIIGSIFRGRIESVTTCGSFPAIVPSVEGWARITGYNTIIIDDEDPYAHGFSVV
jgi:4-hydroxyproline epimerase